nr:uncharacterized protein LOC109158392 [Ipomoea batatas]
MRVNRTYPTIVGWSAELARKRVREENKAGSFGRGTVLPRISKPADIAAATSGQNDQPPVAALNIPSSSVDKVAGILQKLASTVGEFGEAMAEIGKQGAPVNVMRKTFSGLSNMLNVASTIEATATPTSSQLDDIFFGSESFTTAVDALIFFPVLRHGHYFLICINVKASKLEIIDNKSLVSGVTMKDKYGDCTTLLVTALKEYLALGSSALFWKVDELTEEVVDMSWKESENYIDCGFFVMRHMETYKGTLKKWNPGFKKKAKLNEEFLIGLRASEQQFLVAAIGNFSNPVGQSNSVLGLKFMFDVFHVLICSGIARFASKGEHEDPADSETEYSHNLLIVNKVLVTSMFYGISQRLSLRLCNVFVYLWSLVAIRAHKCNQKLLMHKPEQINCYQNTNQSQSLQSGIGCGMLYLPQWSDQTGNDRLFLLPRAPQTA